MKRVGRWAAGPAFRVRTVVQALALPTPLYTSDELLDLAEADKRAAERIIAVTGQQGRPRAMALLLRAWRREAMAAQARESELAANAPKPTSAA